MAIDNIARGMAASSSGGGGGGINADIVKGVGIDFEGTDPITIKNTGVTSISESSTNGTINVSNGGKTPVEVPVHGLGSAAYKNENDFLGSGVKYASSDSVGGSANSAKKLANTEAIGSSTNAVYFNENGVPVACTYEVSEDVPSGAKFTDTTYTISTGDSSGEIKITSSDGDEYSVKVKNLNNAAYKDVADSIAENNEGLVSSGLAHTELNKKVDKSSVTSSVETGNANPVTSGAVYSALTKKADKTIFDVENAGLTPKSTNVNAYLKGDGSWSIPDNTTYTISEGSSNGTIKVTSSDEPNKPVSVPVHGLGSAAYKNVDTSVTENSENLITSGAVSQAINELPNPMLFKGSLGTGGTITYLPTATPENEGYTYKVITAGSYSGKTAKVGDVFISNGSEWIIVPSGDEPSGTVTSVGMSVPTGLKIKGGTSPVTTSGTIEVLLDDGYVIPKTADIVPSTRKINNITLESDVVLDGDDIKATGYAKAESKSNIAGTDTINQAIGKLEYKADTNETNISILKKHVTGELTDSDFQEDSTVAMTKTVPSGMSNYAAISKIGGKTVKDEENQVLLNAVVESVVSVSKNLFSGLKYGKRIDSTGGAEYLSENAACTDFIEVKPSGTIYASGMGDYAANFIAWYDTNKNYINRTDGSRSNTRTAILPKNAKYIRLSWYGGVSYEMYANAKIMISYDSSFPEYSQHFKTTLLIPDSIKSLPDYGVEGNVVDFENGTYTHTNTITDGEVVALSTAETINISDMLIPIRVEAGGTITLQNEHSLDMPNTVVYKKEVSLS